MIHQLKITLVDGDGDGIEFHGGECDRVTLYHTQTVFFTPNISGFGLPNIYGLSNYHIP